jgi:hypothetical protein
MNSRERLRQALRHQATDRPPIDLGSTAVTGAHVSVVHQLRRALGLSVEGPRCVKVHEPYQMLGLLETDLMDALGVDCIGLGLTRTLLGWKNEAWKPWVTFDGTPCLVPGAFNTQPETDGRLLQWPDGDRSASPCAMMPSGGFYHDTIVRQPPIDDATLRLEDNLEEFGPIADEDLEHLRRTAQALYEQTAYGIVGSFGGTAFGDIALVPAPFLKHPKGIRDIAEWYMSTVSRRDFVGELFSRQCEIALKNLELIRQAVGNKVEAVFLTGTDFGTQHGPFIAPAAYRDLYQPFHKRVNDWVHQHTTWQCFIHSCGSVEKLIPDFIAAGFDILNPVQCSARGMEPKKLKDNYGRQLVFWGGATDTQKTLPFGTRDEVATEARERKRVFGQDGGFVFNPIHNIQACSPIENVLELFRVAREGQPNPTSFSPSTAL